MNGTNQIDKQISFLCFHFIQAFGNGQWSGKASGDQSSGLRHTIQTERCIGLISIRVSLDSIRRCGDNEARLSSAVRCQRMLATQEAIFSS